MPFRLTHNLIDALGVTGVEGVFRKAAEITMQLLRDNKDVLMSVLDAFIHDPLVEWEDEKRKMVGVKLKSVLQIFSIVRAGPATPPRSPGRERGQAKR